MLFRNVFRTLRKRYVQLILLGVIIVLSSFIYTTMDYAIMGTLQPTEQYFEEANQEDFAIQMLDVIVEPDIVFLSSNCNTLQSIPLEEWPFTLSAVKTIDASCYYDALDNRLELITTTYHDIELEIREAKDIYFTTNGSSYRFRVLKDMTSINRSYFVAGTKPDEDNEIAVAEVFAKKNNLSIGDPVTILGNTYTISGYVLFPDYSLTMLDAGILIDNQTQTLALMTDSAFEELPSTVFFEGAGVLKDGYTSDEFETDVIDHYRNDETFLYVSNIVLTINNMRSGAIYSELEGGRGMSVFLSLLIASIALMIVGIMVSRVLHSQRGPIGLLQATGYSNKEIALPYMFFIMILSLPMIVLGYYLGLQMAHPFMMIYLDFYLLPSQPIEQSYLTIVVAIVIPFLFIVGLSYIIILRLLKEKPVTLLNPEVTSSSSPVASFVGRLLKKVHITFKLQQLLLYRNIVKFIVFMIGMFYAAFLILFTFSMNGIFDRMIYDYYENTSHNYIGYCDYGVQCSVPLHAEKVIELPSVIANDKDASVVAIDSTSLLHPLYNKKGDTITNELNDQQVIITEALALVRGYKAGDFMTIQFGTDDYTYQISDIANEYTGNKIYMNRETLSNILYNNDDSYNTVYSPTELTSSDYMMVLSIDDIINQADSMSGFMNAFVWIMVAVSISIGAIIIYILTVMSVEDNFYNISLLKVIGYNNKEIDRIVLGGYLQYGIGIFILTIPFAMLSFLFMEMFFAQFYDLLFPLHFEWWHGVLSIVIFIIIFYVGALSAKQKLAKISLQEAMKMYQV